MIRTGLTTRILAPNPGPMTMGGTNSYALRHPASEAVVIVDPGPDIAEHRRALRAQGDIALILLTHRHRDHAEAVDSLHAETGAAVRAADPALCRAAEPLSDGEAIDAAGCRIEVVATPGHTDDSVCFFLPDDRAPAEEAVPGSVLTGDTLLGGGTTLVASFAGALRSYLSSLERLAGLGSAWALPGHGELREAIAPASRRLAAHRMKRLEETREALCSLGLDAAGDEDTVERVVDALYGEMDPARRRGAVATMRATLQYLAEDET